MRAVVVAVSVRDDGKAAEVILIAEHGPSSHTVPGVPNGESVAKQVFCRSGHAEPDLELPVPRIDRLQKTLIVLTTNYCLTVLFGRKSKGGYRRRVSVCAIRF